MRLRLNVRTEEVLGICTYIKSTPTGSLGLQSRYAYLEVEKNLWERIMKDERF